MGRCSMELSFFPQSLHLELFLHHTKLSFEKQMAFYFQLQEILPPEQFGPALSGIFLQSLTRFGL